MNEHKAVETDILTPVKNRPRMFGRFKKLLSDHWPEYILEIMVVIIGITISFAISNYQTDANNRSLERIYMSGLLEDISADIVELDNVIADTKSLLESSRLLMDAIEGKTQLTDDEFIDHVKGIGARPNYVAKNGTFSGMKSSGNFNLISDNELKVLLFEYDAQYQVLKTLEAAELQVVISITGPYILKYIPLSDRSKRTIGKVNAKTFLSDIEFVNNVILRQDNRQELFDSYIKTSGIAKKIKERIQGSLRHA
jgi:hypothetical protein